MGPVRQTLGNGPAPGGSHPNKDELPVSDTERNAALDVEPSTSRPAPQVGVPLDCRSHLG